LLTGVPSALVKESINKNYVLKMQVFFSYKEMQVFSFALAIITQLFVAKLLILVL